MLRVTGSACALLVALSTGCDLYFEDESATSDVPCNQREAVRYDVSSITAPTSADAVQAMATDIDGDGSRENSLTQLLIDIEAQSSWRRGDLADTAWWVDIRDCGDGRVTADLATWDRLGGAVAASGERDGSRLTTRDGAGPVPLSGLADDDEVIEWAVAIGLQVNLDLDSGSGKLAFAIWQPDIERVLAPALGIALTRAAAADPACDAEFCWFHEWDTSLDGVIEGWEVLRHRIGRRLAEPDLDLIDDATGVWAPNVDGIADSHSFSALIEVAP